MRGELGGLLMSNIGKLEVVPVRKAFEKEAHHFTKWLEQHLDALSTRLGIELTIIQREKSVGEFNVDLLCEDEEGRPVIIENQLERTDHDHLGKILTYLVNLNAGTGIWITSEPRPEHQRVIDWLNESTPADISFYLVKIEVVKIGDSPIAPLFTILAGPDMQAKEVGEKKKEWAERHHKRYDFWKDLLELAKKKTSLFNTISPKRYSWIGIGAGKSGIGFNFAVTMNHAQVELYIDFDHDTGEKNKAIFEALKSQKNEIEKEFGEPLTWERLDEKRACRICKRFEIGGLNNPSVWPKLHEKMIDSMVILDKIFRPRVAKIQV